jgi:hypothetical protein
MTVPTYLPFYVLAAVAGILLTLLYGLNQALAKADWPAQHRTRAVARSRSSSSSGLARRWHSARPTPFM